MPVYDLTTQTDGANIQHEPVPVSDPQPAEGDALTAEEDAADSAAIAEDIERYPPDTWTRFPLLDDDDGEAT